MTPVLGFPLPHKPGPESINFSILAQGQATARTVPTVLGVAPSGLGKGTMVASEKARLGTMTTEAKYVFGPSSLSGVSPGFS